MSFVWEFIGIWKQQYFAMIRIQFPEIFRSAIWIVYGFVSSIPVKKVQLENDGKNKLNQNIVKDDHSIDRVECEVLYDPPPGKRRSDVIIIHGLHGSTYKTWRQGIYESCKIKKAQLRRHLSTNPKKINKIICSKCKLIKRNNESEKHDDISIKKNSSSHNDISVDLIAKSSIKNNDKLKDILNEKERVYDKNICEYISINNSNDYIKKSVLKKSSISDISLNGLSDENYILPCKDTNGTINNDYNWSPIDNLFLNQFSVDNISNSVHTSNRDIDESEYNPYDEFNLYDNQSFSYEDTEEISILSDSSNTNTCLGSYDSLESLESSFYEDSSCIIDNYDSEFKNYMNDNNEHDYCLCDSENSQELFRSNNKHTLSDEHNFVHGKYSHLIQECLFYVNFILSFARELYCLYKKLWDAVEEKDLSSCWPKDWLPIDCPDTRIISINYTTFLWMPIWTKSLNRTSLQEKALEMARQLEVLGVGERPVVWAAHSKGGLFIKQIYVNSRNGYNGISKSIFEKTHTIVFYSVPHHGSILAHFFTPPIVKPSIEIKEIRTGSRMVQQLHNEFQEALQVAHENKKINSPPYVISYTETIPTNMSGILLQIVFPTTADPGVGELYGIPLDHRMICKFASRNTVLYKDLIAFIHRAREVV